MARFYLLEIVMDNIGQANPELAGDGTGLSGGTTFADEREARVQGLHAIEEAIAGRIADGMDVPAPMNTPGKGYVVEVPAMTFLKIALYMICSRRGVSRAELARRLEWHREQVDRLFRLDHKSRLDQMEAAFEALGLIAWRIPHSGDGEVA